MLTIFFICPITVIKITATQTKHKGDKEMFKKDALKLFNKLYSNTSRTRQNWKGMLESLETEGEITPKQSYKWALFGAQPWK